MSWCIQASLVLLCVALAITLAPRHHSHGAQMAYNDQTINDFRKILANE